MVGVAESVFVLAGVAVAHELCVGVFELLVDDVYVAEEVDVFVEDAERVVRPESVSVEEGVLEPGADTLRGGTRLRVPLTVFVTEGRRVMLPQEVDVAERVRGAVTVGEGVPVSLNVCLELILVLRERTAVGVSSRQRVGVAEVERVLDRMELRVGVRLVLLERDRAGDEVPVLDWAILRVKVPDAVFVLDPAALRVAVEDTVDVFDWDVEPVEVTVARIVRDGAVEREMVAEPEEVLEGRGEKDCVGLPVELFDMAGVRVGV